VTPTQNQNPSSPNRESMTRTHKKIGKNRRSKNESKTRNSKKNRSKKTLKIKKQLRNPRTNQ